MPTTDIAQSHHCPSCGNNLDGDLIWDTFFERHKDEAKADRIAAMYGATRTEGRWSRAVGLYSIDRDCTYAFRCPDCDHEWRRT
jgi:predicted RNA-binding Zn-ribbon protein involved in translation (DUF1610 family)